MDENPINKQKEISEVKKQQPTKGVTTRSQTNSLATPTASTQIKIDILQVTFTPEKKTESREEPRIEPIKLTNTETRNEETIPINKTPEQTEPTTTRKEEHVRTTIKMNQQQIQSAIANFVPEFNGENRINELDRFIGAADATYESLTTPDERNIFNRLIQFRLTGDAYHRISNRNIKNYELLKETLVNMYGITETLEEREKKFMEVQQGYNESIRNYGYRLAEQLARYTQAYKTKYNIQNIDATYEKHLNETAIHTFKRGLNNTILREKIATHQTEKLEDIIKETEIIEKLLSMTTTPPILHVESKNNIHEQKPNLQPMFQTDTRKQNIKICNFCEKPNHTWDVCRSRINRERQYNTTNQIQYAPYRPQQINTLNPRFTNQQQYQNNYPPNRTNTRNYTATNTDNQQNQYRPSFNRYNQPQQLNNPPPNQYKGSANYNGYQQYNNNNFNRYRQPNEQRNFIDKTPKYCSYCKTTKGHTFEECRSKFLGNRNNEMNKYYQQQPNDTELEKQFKHMTINNIETQTYSSNPRNNQNQTNDTEQQIDQNNPYNQGNAHGSDQM